MDSYLHQNFVFKLMTEEVVDAVNNPKVLQFYLDNGFDFIFSSDLEEMQYMSKAVQIDEADLYRETRLMVFDLMSIRSKV